MLSKKNQDKLIAILENRNFKIFKNNFIAYPEAIPDLITILRIATEQNFKIKIMGYGSKLTPQDSIHNISNSFYLSTSNLNKIIELDEDNQIIELEAGLGLQTLMDYLKKYNYYLPINITRNKSSVGGLLASIKPFSNFISIVKGVHFILPNGKIIKYGGKVLKNCSGYNLIKLISSSGGKFGVLIKIFLKVKKGNDFVLRVENENEIDSFFPSPNEELYQKLKQEIDPKNILI